MKNALQVSLEEGLSRHRVTGVSMAVFDRGAMTIAAAGTVNVTTGVELTPQTVMHIGSVTKVFTATLVLQLVDEGKVGLDEPVVRYLPELRLKDRDALERITVRMLLNHTSGIDGTILPDQGHDEETIEKAIVRFANLGQICRPGTEFAYCNAGMVIAGYLAQRLQGKSWYSLIRERIFEPLQMKHAVTLPEEALLHRASVGHFLSPTDQTPTRTSRAFGPLSRAPSGTTLMMSAADLIAFTRAHMALGIGTNGVRILSADSAKAMQQISVSNKGKGYTVGLNLGLGWMITDDGLLHHGGGGPGFGSVLYAHPEKDFAIAVLTNADYSLGLIDELLEPWLEQVGKTKPLGVVDIRLPSEPVKIDSNKYVGVYEEKMGAFCVAQAADGLAITWQNAVTELDRPVFEATRGSPLIPLGNDEFALGTKGDYRLPDVSRLFTFRSPDINGRMQLLGNVMRLFKRVD